MVTEVFFIITRKKDVSTDSLLNVFKKMQHSDSEGVYIHSEVTMKKVTECYFFGKHSIEEYIGNKIPSIMYTFPIKSRDSCMNYSASCIIKCLSELNEFIFGMSQESHPDSSSEEEYTFDVSNSNVSLHFEERQASFEEKNIKMFIKDDNAFLSLRGEFNTLCKFINGDEEQIKFWRQKFLQGISDATKKNSSSSDDKDNNSSEDSNDEVTFVSCYKGTNVLKKRKKKRIKTKDYIGN